MAAFCASRGPRDGPWLRAASGTFAIGCSEASGRCADLHGSRGQEDQEGQNQVRPVGGRGAPFPASERHPPALLKPPPLCLQAEELRKDSPTRSEGAPSSSSDHAGQAFTFFRVEVEPFGSLNQVAP
eukprot:scaffold1849_cov239-Pinguiococcus_pyrenoidosus.AAC.6